MAKTSKELKLIALDKINSGRLSWTAQNDVSFERGLHHKFNQQLVDGIELYENKYQRLIEAYKEYLDEIQEKIKKFDISKAELKADLLSMKDKVIRMADKYWALKWEIEGRKLNIFKRNPVGTTYYIDLDNGNDGNDGLSPGQAWLTIEKYTTITSRSIGDIAKVRAGTTQVKTDANIAFDEDGSKDAYIEILGCSIADDPWGDASDVKPVLSFNDTSYRLDPMLDDFWKMSRLVMKEGSSSDGIIRLQMCIAWHFLDCELTDNSNASGKGLYINDGVKILLENCILQNNTGYNVMIWAGSCKLINCDLNGGATGTKWGFEPNKIFAAEAIDCRFGQITAHSVCDVLMERDTNGVFSLRNCKLNTIIADGINSVVYEEDVNGVYGSHRTTSKSGVITKDTNIKRASGASSSAKMEPSNGLGVIFPLILGADITPNPAFKIWLASGTEKTITIYIRSLGVWSAYPTNTELYIEASYLSNGATADRTKIKSTQVLSDETTWVAFTVTFTPLQTGWVYVNVFLKKYEASKGCYVDIKPVIT